VDSAFTPQYLETEFDHERVGVTLWDSQGLEKKFVDLQLREMSSFLESKFEETFTEEQKVVRAPGVRDTHIHCVFLILDPARLDSNIAHTRKQQAKSPVGRFEEPLRLMGILDEDLDVQVLKTLQGKTTVIPVISKADTITANHMTMLKRAVWDSLKQAKLDPLEALTFNEDEDDSDVDRFDERDEDAALHQAELHDRDDSDIIDNLIDRSDGDEDDEDGEHPSAILPNPQARPQNHRRSPSGLSARLSQALDMATTETPYLPMSIISPDSYEPGIVGRRFPWGFADPYNPEHCDFVRLKDSVFSEWRSELREASRETWYEGWRTSRLNRRGGKSNGNNGNGGNSGNGYTAAAATNGRNRNVSGSASARSLGTTTASNAYGGGPVGGSTAGYTSYSAPPSQAGPRSPQGVSPPSHGNPEMVSGMYRHGVNAF
jgi:septin family protein